MKEFRIDNDILLSDSEYVIEVSSKHLQLWCLSFTLLATKLVSSFNILFKNHRVKILLSEDLENKWLEVIKKDASITEVAIPMNQVEYLQFTLLRALRDSIAEMEHIHLEGSRNSEQFNITLFFENYSQPFDPEEAAKLMR